MPDHDRSSVTTTLAAAIAATMVVALPTLLVGGMAVLIQRDLGFGERQLGVAIAASFAAGALVAAPAGRLVERIGPRRTTWLGLASATAALLGIGLVAGSGSSLVAFLALAGIGVTTVQLGVNVLLARRVPAGQQGIAFGAKQAAVPAASLVAGLALPVIGLTLGWRPAFLLAALAVPLVAWAIPDAAAPSPAAQPRDRRDARLGALVLLAVGVMLASAGGNSIPAFLVASSVDRGLEPAHAGLVLAFGSGVGVVVRVAGGWVGDRLGRGSLLLVSGLIAIGIGGYLGLALATHPVLIAGSAALAFGGGWGWAGLILLAVSRSSPNATGRAMGIVQIGPMTGAVVGPLLFGVLAEEVGFGAGWTALAVMGAAGVVTILASRRLLLRDRAATTPAAGSTESSPSG